MSDEIIRLNLSKFNTGTLYLGKIKLLLKNFAIEKYSGDGYIEGQSYEKTKETKYQNIKYKLIHSKTNTYITEYLSNDGRFKFENLKKDELYTVMAYDMNNNYTGKFIDNLIPKVDYQKAIKIINIYMTKESALFNIKYSGSFGNLIVLAENGNIDIVETGVYKVTNIRDDLKITVYDRVDDQTYVKEQTYRKK